jgi:NSS family neurotransmitter:Na+ symporter
MKKLFNNEKQKTISHSQWSSRGVFLLAAIGSAVGLGNIWKFPYIVGENGGGAFVLVYLLCIVLVGVPVLIAEIALGKSVQSNPVSTFSTLAMACKASRFWVLFGYVGIVSGFLILSFYSVVAGWSLEYLQVFIQNDLLGSDARAVEQYFTQLLASPNKLLLWHSVFMLLTVAIVARGIRKGIEKIIIWSMPILFVILVILVLYATQLEGFSKAFDYLFVADFSKLTTDGVLIALGHSFFTLSLGMGAMMVYGSYLQKDTPVVKLSFIIAIADTLVALMAGLAIFPLIFTYGLESASGPSLLFISLPNALLNLPFGQFFGIAFFFLLLIAALSSAISILEPVVSFVQQKTRLSRHFVTYLIGSIIWLIGVGALLAFNDWSDVHLLGQRNIFDSLDYVTTSILLPLGGFGVSIFAVWVVSKQPNTRQLLGISDSKYPIWRISAGIIAPIVIGIIAWHGLN